LPCLLKFLLLPSSTLSFESINGLIHWWGQSLYDRTTSQTAFPSEHCCVGDQPFNTGAFVGHSKQRLWLHNDTHPTFTFSFNWDKFTEQNFLNYHSGIEYLHNIIQSPPFSSYRTLSSLSKESWGIRDTPAPSSSLLLR
jgi:hypothetical protein